MYSNLAAVFGNYRDHNKLVREWKLLENSITFVSSVVYLKRTYHNDTISDKMLKCKQDIVKKKNIYVFISSTDYSGDFQTSVLEI